jgi:hypothetical protein
MKSTANPPARLIAVLVNINKLIRCVSGTQLQVMERANECLRNHDRMGALIAEI